MKKICSFASQIMLILTMLAVSCSVAKADRVVLYQNNSTLLTNDYSNTSGMINYAGIVPSTAISAGGRHTVLLRPDGTLDSVGDDGEKQRDLNGWDHVVKVSAGIQNTVALMEDGTALATGNNQFGQCNVSDWANMVDVDTQQFHTVGLQADGRVVAVGFTERGACNVNEWKNIVEVAAGE